MTPSGDAPQKLVHIADTLNHPAILQRGLTATPKGEWALYVVVRHDVSTPLPDVEAMVAPFPVVYDTAEELPIARPAWPELGE